MTERVFTTNWYIDRICQPEISEDKSRRNATHCIFASEETSMHDRRFEECLSEAVDEELSALGEPVRRAIYSHLEKTFKIARHDIPNRIDKFADAVEKIFGVGAKFLEIQIMKRLYGKLGKDMIFVSDNNELAFTEYVEAAKLADNSC